MSYVVKINVIFGDRKQELYCWWFIVDDEDNFNFEERFAELKAEFAEQIKEEQRLNALILENLAKIKMEK